MMTIHFWVEYPFNILEYSSRNEAENQFFLINESLVTYHH